MKAKNLNDVRAILEKFYIYAVVMEDVNPNKYFDRQYLIWAIIEEIFGKSWADNMTAAVRKNYTEGKYDE